MWQKFSTVLADGIKEFKAALDETSEEEEEADVKEKDVPDMDSPQIAITSGAGDGSEVAQATSSNGVEVKNVQVSPSLSAGQNIAPSWEVQMLENEIARLRAEVETLKNRNKELEDQLRERRPSSAETIDISAVRDEERESLKEEVKILKKALKQVMNKVIPTPLPSEPQSVYPSG